LFCLFLISVIVRFLSFFLSFFHVVVISLKCAVGAKDDIPMDLYILYRSMDLPDILY